MSADFDGNRRFPIRDLDGEAAERGRDMFNSLFGIRLTDEQAERIGRRLLILTTPLGGEFDAVKAWVKPEAQPEPFHDLLFRWRWELRK